MVVIGGKIKRSCAEVNRRSDARTLPDSRASIL
jgi:hypothetical protein